MTYFLYSGDALRKFLAYYSYVAMTTNRIYFTLITLSIVASASRCGCAKRVPPCVIIARSHAG